MTILFASVVLEPLGVDDGTDVSKAADSLVTEAFKTDVDTGGSDKELSVSLVQEAFEVVGRMEGLKLIDWVVVVVLKADVDLLIEESSPLLVLEPLGVDDEIEILEPVDCVEVVALKGNVDVWFPRLPKILAGSKSAR